MKQAVKQAKQEPGFFIPEKKDWKTQEILSAARYTMNPGEAARSIPFARVVDPSGASRPSVPSWADAGCTRRLTRSFRQKWSGRSWSLWHRHDWR